MPLLLWAFVDCSRMNFTCTFTVCCRREGETFPVLDVAGFCVQHMGEGTA